MHSSRTRRGRSAGSTAAAALLPVALLALTAPPAWSTDLALPGTRTSRVSSDSAGRASDGESNFAAISGNGRFVVFVSRADDLVPGDTNGRSDVFVRDLEHGTTSRVSVGAAGAQGNASSTTASISADGRYVAFVSFATNLVRGDTNRVADVFVRDRLAQKTVRASVTSAERQSAQASGEPSLSADGSLLSFRSLAPLVPAGIGPGVYVRDLRAGRTTLASRTSTGEPARQPQNSFLSGNGRYVLFATRDAHVVPGDTNGSFDLFLRDRLTDRTERVSVSSAERQASGDSSVAPVEDRLQAAEISPDGRFVAFYSAADDLVRGDTNGAWDVFLRDRRNGTTTRVSISDAEAQADGYSYAPSVSADGRHVAFVSSASNLTRDRDEPIGPYDLFLRDVSAGTTTRLSWSTHGSEPNGDSLAPSISADGTRVAYVSAASDLVDDDTNDELDVFLRD